jgi:mycoredoxin-dependent peroxiredoxin
MTVEVGAYAPDFELCDQHGTPVRLSDLRGRKNVVLVFYPWAFSGVCTGELADLQAELSALPNDSVAPLAVSVDSRYAQRAFADTLGLAFPLLADFWPHGGVARAYGVFDESSGAALRGSFVIDRAGVVRWRVLHGLGDARDIAAYHKALAEI